MTAEILHDALTLLPADLIAEADKKRNRQTRIIPWKRYISLAACLALCLCGTVFFSLLMVPKGGSSEEAFAIQEAAEAPAAAEGAALSGSSDNAASQQIQDEATPAESVCGLPTAPAGEAEIAEETFAISLGSSFITPANPTTACYLSTPRTTLIRSRTELDDYLEYYAYRYDFSAMTEACERYDTAWFETQDLLLLAIHCVPVEENCSIASVTEQDGIWEISITPSLSEPSEETVDWHLLLDIEKGRIPGEDSVILSFG